tara:strand:+ start:2657 stop:3001 length:345 start_codon:yes stop_codon:yes gene_type:complete
MITTEYLFQLVPLIMVVFYLNVVLKLMTSENVLLNDFLLNDKKEKLTKKKNMNDKLILSDKLIKTNECIICFEKLKKTNKFILRCGHQYCGDCFIIYLKSNGTTCPQCRTTIVL